jgi:hypothetical protein
VQEPRGIVWRRSRLGQVGQKNASGSGTVSGAINRGVWSDRSGKSQCVRTWVAQSNRKVPRTASDRRRRRRQAVADGPEPERLQDDDEPRDSDRKGPPKNVVADRERELRSREQNLIHRVGPPIRSAAVRPALRASRQSLRRRAIGSASVAWECREEGVAPS